MNRLPLKKLILTSSCAASLSFAFFGHNNNEAPSTSFGSVLSDVLEPSKSQGKQSLKQLEDAYITGTFRPSEEPADVDPKIWVLLALQKSPLARLHKPKTDKTDFNDNDFDAFLHKLDLDKVWDAALTWYTVSVCGEEDLHCQDAVFKDVSVQEKPLKIQRLTNLMHVLLYKVEFDSCKRMVNQGILQALISIFKIYNDKHKDLGIVVLKVLSEIAHDGKPCAEAIVQSDWYPLLIKILNNPVHQEEEILAQKIFVNLLYSFGLEKHHLPQSIYELHRPPVGTEPVMDVVFVHGLRGSAFRTWRQKDDPKKKTTKFWPRHWLYKDIDAPVRMLAVDYPTKLLQFGQLMETVSDRSRKFHQSFKDAGIGTGTRPVVFISHSMGGLLIKQMLLENENLRKNTLGVLFLATPHRGSPVASSFAHSVLRPSDDVKFLKVENALNKQLNNDFMDIAKSIPLIVSAVEMKRTKMFGMSHQMVPSESGVLGIGALYHIDEHHHNVCKPENVNSPSYGIILNFIREGLKHAGASKK